MLFYMFCIPAAVYTSMLLAYLQAKKEIASMSKVQILIRTMSFAGIIFLTYLLVLIHHLMKQNQLLFF